MGISEAGMFAAMKHATMSLNAHFNSVGRRKGPARRAEYFAWEVLNYSSAPKNSVGGA